MALTPETLAKALLADPDIEIISRSNGHAVSLDDLSAICRYALEVVQRRQEDLIPAELREVAAILLLPVAPAPLGAFAEQMLEASFTAKPGTKLNGAVLTMPRTARVLHARDLLYQYLERNKPKD